MKALIATALAEEYLGTSWSLVLQPCRSWRGC